MRLSVLDLVPVRTDQTTPDALAAATSLARTADAAGFTRYWVAEHHNMPMIASTSPPVLIAHLAAATARIRVGSGGVMLPNHAPLAVAEQFALLEAAHPDRIDLGIGRAPGTDPVTSWALRGPAGRDDTDIAEFPQYLDDVMALMDRRGVTVRLPGRTHPLHATPAPVTTPQLWLLGSSMYSAELAARKGLRYVFAHHFSGRGTDEALAHYRRAFRPGDTATEPVTFLTVNASVAPTREEAVARAVPQMVTMARLRGGLPLGPLELVEDAATSLEQLPPALQDMVAEGLERAVVGDPAEAAAQLRALAARFEVEEVMVHAIGSARRGEAPSSASAREETLTLLAKELL